MTSAQPIATIRKSGEEEIRVTLTTTPVITVVDMRVFAFFRRQQDMKPTARGICMRVERLPELISALQAAYDTARQSGSARSEVGR